MKYFDESVIALIKRRCSWRSYSDRPVEEDKQAALGTCISRLEPPPFGSKAHFVIVDVPQGKGGVKGTYGVIRGALTFLVGATMENPKAMDDFGYLFEQLILCATSMDLATCWMGGTFSRSAFAQKIGLQPGEVLPAVSPLGYSAERRTVVDSLIRLMAGSRNRKPWGELFFRNNFSNPINELSTGDLVGPLEMVRIGPSASNNQPWRLVLGSTTTNFFLQRTRGYDRFSSLDLQRLDMGIAMCHFELTAKELGMRGRWEVKNVPIPLPERTEYCVSWIREE